MSDALRGEGSDAARLTDDLETLLRDAVRIRLESDVPLGALLSGGVDSSTVVALMQAESGQPVRTYTIGFDVAAHDESRQAAAVAAHIGTQHTTMQVSGREALDLVPSLPDFFDEPLADPSAIPTYLVVPVGAARGHRGAHRRRRRRGLRRVQPVHPRRAAHPGTVGDARRRRGRPWPRRSGV